jgi:predicted HTH transcriptional regulator
MAKRLSQRDALILKAENANQESKQLDFKGQFEDTTECWCALTKDIVAMANSGGGILVFGANSDGTPSGADCNALLKCDLAVISSKVFKWTGYEFAEFETSHR